MFKLHGLKTTYAPGATLNPACGPTETNCAVTPPLTISTNSSSGLVVITGDGVEIKDKGVALTKLATSGCSNGQVIKFNGTDWVCDTSSVTLDGTTLSNSVAGLKVAPGGITNTQIADDTITFAKLSSNSCTADKLIRYNGTSWVCDLSLSTNTNLGTSDTVIATQNAVKTYTDAQMAGGLLKTNNLSDLNNVTTARANLGLTIGTNVQAYNARLAEIAGITPTAGSLIVDNGTSFTNLNIGSSGSILMSNGSTPFWIAAAGIGQTYTTGSGLTNTANVFALDLTHANNWTGIQTLTSPILNGAISGTSISTDGTFTANSDTLLASQKAILTLVNNRVSGLSWRPSITVLDTSNTSKPNNTRHKLMVTLLSMVIGFCLLLYLQK